MSLYSKTILEAVKTAMDGLGELAGSKSAPLHVERYDAERGRTRELPGIRVRRAEETLSILGSASKYSLGEHLDCSVSIEVWVFSILDRASSESYDEILEEDVGTVLRALLDVDWNGLRANPLPFAWVPIQIESEEDVNDGAVIRFTPRWRSPAADLGDKAEGWYE